MKITRIVSVGVTAFTLVGGIAWAQQTHSGMITQINRLNNTVAIRQTQNGTVGANTSGASEEFKVQSGISLETLHAGDVVNYSANETGGSKTITKLQKQ